MQEGMRKKSKDIIFVQSIIYLANKKFFDINDLSLWFSSIGKNYIFDLFISLLLKLKEPASIPLASSWRPSYFRFSDLTS